jgi:heme-degrading monooxygenase HmoA
MIETKVAREDRTKMIARIWRGVTRAEKAEQYLAYLIETGLKDYRAVPGNQGIEVLRRTYEDKTEFLLISFWESYEAIRAFAGDDPERAVYYPLDEEFLLDLEPQVTHYEVAAEYDAESA